MTKEERPGHLPRERQQEIEYTRFEKRVLPTFARQQGNDETEKHRIDSSTR